jgi:hypothetical protein
MSDLEIRLGASINSDFYFDRLQLSLFVNGGLGIRSRADFSTGSKMDSGIIHGFLEIGTRFGYQLKGKNSIQ